MAKRKHKRKRKMRITPRGYIVLGAAALVVCLLIFLLIRICIVYFDLDEKKKVDGGQAAEAVASETAAPGEAAPESAVTPGFTPSPTPTASQALATTGARLPTEEEEAGAVEGIIRTSNIAMRKGAGKAFEIVRKYDVGERVLVYAEENEYSLVRVLSDERIGFIATEFIVRFGLLPGEVAACTPVPSALAGTVMGLVNVEEVSLRSAPSKKGNTPLCVLKNRELLWIYLQADEFYYVQVASTGQKGYVFAEYVMTQAPIPTGSPVPGA